MSHEHEFITLEVIDCATNLPAIMTFGASGIQRIKWEVGECYAVVWTLDGKSYFALQDQTQRLKEWSGASRAFAN